MTPINEDQLAKRGELVEEHITQENRHNLTALMDTFGETACYEDKSVGERFEGRDDVRSYYEALLAAVPDLHIEVTRRHVTDEVVILEVVISGTHNGPWRGLGATGYRLTFPLCSIYHFDEQDKLASERIFYDRATVLRQLGVFHEPEGFLGRLLTLFTHPVTMARAATRKVRGL